MHYTARRKNAKQKRALETSNAGRFSSDHQLNVRPRRITSRLPAVCTFQEIPGLPPGHYYTARSWYIPGHGRPAAEAGILICGVWRLCARVLR